MRTLIEKEVRLLLPAFAAALVLAVLPVWFLPLGTFEYGENGALEGYLFLFGIVLLALSSFGREIGLKTVPFALAQPLERSRIWWTKVEVLAVFLAVTFDAWLLSVTLCSSFQPLRFVPSDELALCGLAVIALTAGGLWLTLLLRQVVAALVLAVLIPMSAVITIKAFGGEDWMSVTVLAIYSVAGFFQAWRQFLCLQDTAWTGGMVSIGRSQTAAAPAALRVYSPWEELIRKELQLHQFTLAGMAALFGLHLGVILLRKLGVHTFNHTFLSALEMFGVIWLFVPLLVGGQSVAEERQLNTLDSLLCLPVSRRAQFVMKLVFVLLIGGVLGATLLCLAEEIGVALGAGANVGVMGVHFSNLFAVACFFMILALLGFYASTLTRGLVPALAVGIVLTIIFWMIQTVVSQAFFAFGYHLWPVMGPPALLVAILWLAWGNFRWVFESGRRWRRNIFALITVIVLACGTAASAYHRVWELAMPPDLPHGPARIPAGKPALLSSSGDQLAAVLPDGRLWVWHQYYPKHGRKVVESRFANGSNWVEAVQISQTVALQSNGTLWLSTNFFHLGELVQLGSETRWQRILRLSYDSVILLQKDGTLWSWGGPWPAEHTMSHIGLQSVAPARLGPDSDWVRGLAGPNGVYAWKADGSAWVFYEAGDQNSSLVLPPSSVEVAPDISMVREPVLDHTRFQSFTWCPRNGGFGIGRVGLREDGSLWYWDATKEWPMYRSTALRLARQPTPPGLVQIGKDTNWAAVEGLPFQLVARKTDGSLWHWVFETSEASASFRRNVAGQTTGLPVDLENPPSQIGTHYDWVALSGFPSRHSDPLVLAADGSLWRWPNTENDLREGDEQNGWLAPSRKPFQLENILDAK